MKKIPRYQKDVKKDLAKRFKKLLMNAEVSNDLEMRTHWIIYDYEAKVVSLEIERFERSGKRNYLWTLYCFGSDVFDWVMSLKEKIKSKWRIE